MNRIWNVLDVGSVWMKEFAAALQAKVAVNAWTANFGLLHTFSKPTQRTALYDPPLQMISFPLQRGYSNRIVQTLAPFQHRLLASLLRETSNPVTSPLVCSSPFYAPVAALWPGPVVYYSTDLTIAYPNLDPRQVLTLDRQLCARATFVCPNSRRIAHYFVRDALCSPQKIHVVPNATRTSNVAATPFDGPSDLPADLRHLSRPIVGVLGDLSANTDWKLLLETIEAGPEFSWVFVGPTHPIADTQQARARFKVQQRATFVGMKPYHALQSYARCFDVAVLPYRASEPTYSGSSTRFYEHLAAARPMLGTRGFAELKEKGSLIHLVDTAQELLAGLRTLQRSGFVDGCEKKRWLASREGTWTVRAETMLKLFDTPAKPEASEVPMTQANPKRSGRPDVIAVLHAGIVDEGAHAAPD